MRLMVDGSRPDQIYARQDVTLSIIVQQDATVYYFILFLQTALCVSDDTLIHHQEHTQTVITASGTGRSVP